jgi:hypothetical protein
MIWQSKQIGHQHSRKAGGPAEDNRELGIKFIRASLFMDTRRIGMGRRDHGHAVLKHAE